jgi:hypothetical protein
MLLMCKAGNYYNVLSKIVFTSNLNETSNVMNIKEKSQ